jgi:hypothetical protein
MLAGLTLAAAAVALRLATLVDVPVNWDAAQLVLATERFDVADHRPHPPGYPLYIGAGWLLARLTGDRALALSLLSALSAGPAVWLLFLLGRIIGGPALGLAAGALLATSPLAWYYGSVGLAYGPELALATAVALCTWHAIDRRDERALLLGAAALALAGGIRPSAVPLLLPLWSIGLVRQRRTPAFRACGILVLGCLAWALPLLWLSGGPERYLAASRRLATFAAESTSAAGGGLDAVAWNAWFVAVGLLLGLGPLAAAIPIRLGTWARAASARPRLAWLLALWIAPALLVYLALHIGQLGYLLLFFPALCLLLADALLAAGATLAGALRRERRLGAAVAVIAAVATNVTVFLGTPNALSGRSLADERRFWSAVAAARAELPPSSTIVVTGGRGFESFRQAMVQLPEYRVFAVGSDRAGRVGLLFSADRGEADYGAYLDGRPAAPVLEPPAGATNLLVLDEAAARLIGQELPLSPLTVVGHRVVLAHRADAPLPPLDVTDR